MHCLQHEAWQHGALDARDHRLAAARTHIETGKFRSLWFGAIDMGNGKRAISGTRTRLLPVSTFGAIAVARTQFLLVGFGGAGSICARRTVRRSKISSTVPASKSMKTINGSDMSPTRSGGSENRTVLRPSFKVHIVEVLAAPDIMPWCFIG
jgi:hypothetical protein